MRQTLAVSESKPQTRWDRLRPVHISRRAKISITAVSLLLFLAIFPTIFAFTGAAGSALVALPFGIIAWIWGIWGGLIIGLLTVPYSAFSLMLVGEELTLRGGISGAVTVFLLCLIIGWLSTLLGQLYQQSLALKAARDEALEANRLKTLMLSKVSHELRTPLSAILGYAELLADGTYGEISSKQHTKLTRIVESSLDLETLVSDLLDMSRIESGKMVLFPKPFNVGMLVDGVVSKTAVSAQQKKLKVTCFIDPSLPETLVGDKHRLAQILSNLVTNAIKYTETGQVNVETLHLPESNQWQMKVTDTGIGIAPEAQQFIFDSFRQAVEDDAHVHSGVGLGLSIVCELVSLMDGDIGVKSELDKGSCFTVKFPLIQPVLE